MAKQPVQDGKKIRPKMPKKVWRDQKGAPVPVTPTPRGVR